MTNLKKAIAFVLVLFLIFVVGCGMQQTEEITQEQDDFMHDNAGTEIIPSEQIIGDVAAVVNGDEILVEEVISLQQHFLMMGQQISQEEALEQLILEKLLEQEVKEEGFIVSEEEAESIIEQQLALQGATLEDYKQQLELQGISYTEELENIKEQLAIQNYLEDQLGGETFDVSEEEAKAFYEIYKLQSPEEEVLSYEELEPQIIASLQQEKQQQAINAILQELRIDADIEYR